MAETRAITWQASLLGRGGILAALHYDLHEAQRNVPLRPRGNTVVTCWNVKLGTLLCLGIITGVATALPV